MEYNLKINPEQGENEYIESELKSPSSGVVRIGIANLNSN